jgi:hypothetical protein
MKNICICLILLSNVCWAQEEINSNFLRLIAFNKVINDMFDVESWTSKKKMLKDLKRNDQNFRVRYCCFLQQLEKLSCVYANKIHFISFVLGHSHYFSPQQRWVEEYFYKNYST